MGHSRSGALQDHYEQLLQGRARYYRDLRHHGPGEFQRDRELDERGGEARVGQHLSHPRRQQERHGGLAPGLHRRGKGTR